MPAPKDFGVQTNVTFQLPVAYASAAAAVTGQPIDWSGQLAVLSTTPIRGLLVEDATTGKTVGLAMEGLAEGLAGGAIGVGSPVGADATGRLVVVAAGNHSIGRAASAATAAGQKFQVYITREGTN